MKSRFLNRATEIAERFSDRLNQDQIEELKVLIVNLSESAKAEGISETLSDPAVRERLRQETILVDD
jgi:hypothetical protein